MGSAPAGFEPCRFVCFVQEASLRVDKNGALMLTLVVPEEGVEEAFRLRQFARVSPPLEATVGLARGWAELVEENGRRAGEWEAG